MNLDCLSDLASQEGLLLSYTNNGESSVCLFYLLAV